MKVAIKNFQKKVPIYPKRIKKTILKILRAEKRKISGEITVCFVGDKKIKELNRRFHYINSPTDVLAFENRDFAKPGQVFADIVVSSQTAVRNARIFKTSCDYELNLYIVHGLLHILGYADHTVKHSRLMRKKENRYVHS